VGEPQLLVRALASFVDDREDRLTEVVAAVLCGSAEFCRRLMRGCGVEVDAASFQVRTQQTFDGHRKLVDLVIEGGDSSGATIATVFVESKYNPTRRLEPHWFSERQSSDQRAALNAAPGVRRLVGIASRCDLERVGGPAERHLEFDPRLAYDVVMSWEEVRDVAEETGGVAGWEAQARLPDAPAGQRLLLEFLAYFDMEGDIMGALDEDDVFVLSREARANERVGNLLDRTGRELVGTLGGLPDYEIDADGDPSSDARRQWLLIDPPKHEWLFEARQGGTFVMIGGSQFGEETSVGMPYVYAGLMWELGREARGVVSGSSWEEKAKKDGLNVLWEATWCYVASGKPLKDVVESGDDVASQAKALAQWAQQRILSALRLPEPPEPKKKKRSGR
jgi:hypothetical protein